MYKIFITQLNWPLQSPDPKYISQLNISTVKRHKSIHNLIKILIIMFFVGMMSLEASAQKQAETIPKFIFYRLDKTPFTNRNLIEGKKKLFILFDVTCDHCQKVIISLNKRINECNKTSVYLVTLDDKIAVNTFLNQYGKKLIFSKNVTILQDSKNQFITIFGPRKYPSVFLYSAQQKLILYSDEDQYLEKFFKFII